MANNITFNIKFKVDGKDQLSTATVDVERLTDALSDAQSSATRFRDDMWNMSLIYSVVEDAQRAISGLASGVRELTDVWFDQQQAETRLANNMRNTIGATADDIDAIKRLCSAQQELGVVGDEVQLVGAQELATYVSLRGSLERLIPVMNDMLVQQYGLNATQESAQNIATMLGKVLDGQTGALSRYGYKFDEVQEQILKFGSEEERVAVLAEVVESSVGGANAAMAQTDAGRAQQAANAWGDFRESVGGLLVPLRGVITIVERVSSTFLQIGGAVLVVSRLRASLQGLNIMASLSALRARAVAAAQSVAAMAAKLWAATNTTCTATTIALKAAVSALYATITLGLSVAIEALIGLVSSLAGKESDAASAADDMSEAQMRAKAAAEEEETVRRNTIATLNLNKAKLEELMQAQKTGKDVSKEEKKVVEELNDTYGDTMGYFSSVSAWYNALCANSEAYCQQMANEISMRRMANEMADLLDARDKAKALAKSFADTSGAGDDDRMVLKPGYKYTGQGAGSSPEKVQRAVVLLGRRSLEAKFGVDALDKAIDNLDKKMRGRGSGKVDMPVVGSRVRPSASGPVGSADRRDTAASHSPSELSLVAVPKTLKDLENNVRYYEQELGKADIADTRLIESLYRLKRQAQEAVDGFKKLGEAPKESGAEAKGGLAGLEAELTRLRGELREATDIATAVAIRIEIQDVEEQIDALESKLAIKPLHVDVKTEQVDRAKEKFDATWESVSEMGSAFAAFGNAIDMPVLDVAGTIAQAIATMVKGYSEASAMAATELGPWGWIAFAATGLAQLTAIVSSVKGMAQFADGGIVSGATLALVGEYAGAANNPEVIAPLDKLRSLIATPGVPGGGGSVSFRISGRNLVGVLQNERQIASRSGRRE